MKKTESKEREKGENVTRRRAGVGKEQEKMKMSADSKWVGADCEGARLRDVKEGKRKKRL